MRSGRPAPPRPEDLLETGAAALGIPLDTRQLDAFRRYREEIARWSSRMNLTSLRDPEAIVREGFLDSLACLPLVPAGASRALDIGSGAGYPALPLKLARPSLHFTLVEASRKKASFLRHVIRALGLEGVRVVRCRAEELARQASEAGAYDVALARAVAPLPEQGRLVRPFLRPGGLFLAQVGADPLAGPALAGLAALGFEPAGELALPAALGRPGRRVVALSATG
jgi:16S rRNA (guanine527-N7)-methyltransferase